MSDPVEPTATIVVFEDDEATLDLLREPLVADGCEVLPASTAAEALELCRSREPDLLLLGLALPGAAWFDLLRKIRGSDGVDARLDPRLPIIVLSSRGAAADRLRALGLGADHYLDKPFTHDVLRVRIAKVLRRRSGSADAAPGGAAAGMSCEALAGVLVEEVGRTAVVVKDVITGLLEALPEDVFPGERNGDVILEMIAGSFAPAAAAAGEAGCRSAIELVAAIRERVIADLHTAVETAAGDRT